MTGGAPVLAAALVGAAVLLSGPAGARRRARAVLRGVPAPDPAPTAANPSPSGPRWLSGLPWSRWRGRAGAEPARRAALVEVCRAVAGELRAGRAPQTALLVAVEPLLAPGVVPAAVRSDLLPLLSAARTGAPVPPVLRALSAAPGAEVAASLALCWTVAGQTGAGLAGAVERVADGAAAAQALHRRLAAELAAPRATARLLALLPAIGVLMGTALGAHPLSLLLTTPLGLSCLTAGAALTAAGAWWARRIVRSVTGP